MAYKNIGIKRREERINGYLLHDIANYVDFKWSVYSNKFKKIIAGKKSFNWYCALFDSIWFGYRKMIHEARIAEIVNCTSIIAVTIISSLIFKMTNSDADNIIFYVSIIGVLYLAVKMYIYGRIGDELYFKSVQKKLDEHELKNRNNFECTKLRHNLFREGGVSMYGLAGFSFLKVTIGYILFVVCIFLGIVIRYY